MEKKSRKYNSEFRKSIKQKISKITNKFDYIQIYKIIISELENKISSNRNGIYFNLNLLSDKTLEKIITFLDNITDTEINSEYVKVKYETYNKDTNIVSKLSYCKIDDYKQHILISSNNIMYNTVDNIIIENIDGKKHIKILNNHGSIIVDIINNDKFMPSSYYLPNILSYSNNYRYI